MSTAFRVISSRFTARHFVAVALAVSAAVGSASIAAAKEPEDRASYKSPYSVEFDYKLPELVGDLQSTPRGNPHDSSSLPYSQWYSEGTRRNWGVGAYRRGITRGYQASNVGRWRGGNNA